MKEYWILAWEGAKRNQVVWTHFPVRKLWYSDFSKVMQFISGKTKIRILSISQYSPLSYHPQTPCPPTSPKRSSSDHQSCLDHFKLKVNKEILPSYDHAKIMLVNLKGSWFSNRLHTLFINTSVLFGQQLKGYTHQYLIIKCLVLMW